MTGLSPGPALLLFAFSFFFSFSTVSAIVKPDQSERYVVVRITPSNESQLAVLKQLYRDSHKHELDFWKAPMAVEQFADVMVSTEAGAVLFRLLDQHNIHYIITIDDVQQLMLEREKTPRRMPEDMSNPLFRSFFKRYHDDSSSRNKAEYPFGDYTDYARIQQWLFDIERFYPQFAKTFNMGTTVEGRQITGIKLGSPIQRTDKRIVFIDGGIHAREWAAVHTALYFADQLITGYESGDPQIRYYMEQLNFYIVPVVNPDGFEFSRSDVTPQIRFWRKNRGGIVCKKDMWFRERCCGGVDLNRNFDFHWGEAGSSSDSCSEIYQGGSAFSEPESRALRDKLLSPELFGKVDAYITLHTYSQMFIHPFNHLPKTVPADIQDIQEVGRWAVNSLQNAFGTKYKFGTGADILYPSAGGSDDWAKAKGGVKYVYLIELRPGEDVWDGFLLDRRELIPTGKETWEGVKVVVNAVVNHTPHEPADVHALRAITQATAPPTTTRPPPPPPPLPTTTRPPSPSPTTVATTPSRQVVFVTRPPSSTVAVPSHAVDNSAAEKAAALLQQIALERQQQQQNRGSGTVRRRRRRCRDKSPFCVPWTQMHANICSISSIYMRRDCARTCGFCRVRTRPRKRIQN